jgi:hypothetical protein
MSLTALAAIAGVVVAIGGAWVVLLKVVKAMRRFARFLDGWFGDGTVKHPSVLDRLGTMESNQEQFKIHQDQGTSDLAAVKSDVAAVKAQTASIETKLDGHVDGDAKTWLAEGQEWGNRLDGQVADLSTRVSTLEQHASE